MYNLGSGHASAVAASDQRQIYRLIFQKFFKINVRKKRTTTTNYTYDKV